MERIPACKRHAVLILTIAALVCALISGYMLLTASTAAFAIIHIVLMIVPTLLFIIYLCINKRPGFPILLSIVYIGILLYFLHVVYFKGSIVFYDALGIAGAVLGLLAVFNGLSNKKLVYASTVCFVLSAAFSIAWSYLFNNPYASILFGDDRLLLWLNKRFLQLLLWLNESYLLLTAASLMIYGLNDTLEKKYFHFAKKEYALPHAISGSSSTPLDPASELRALESDYRSGKIDSEEYSARRAEIIKRL